jgi:hypothetical protein
LKIYRQKFSPLAQELSVKIKKFMMEERALFPSSNRRRVISKRYKRVNPFSQPSRGDDEKLLQIIYESA